MLRGEDFLLAVARIALTFVTFAGIVNLLRHGRNPWSLNEIRGLKLMVTFDLAAMLFALIPFPLFYSMKNGPSVWRCSSALLVMFLVYELVVQWRNYAGAQPRHPRLFVWLFIVPMIAAIILEITCTLVRPSLALYSWGLLWLMGPPAIQFLIYLSHFGESSSAQKEAIPRQLTNVSADND